MKIHQGKTYTASPSTNQKHLSALISPRNPKLSRSNLQATNNHSEALNKESPFFDFSSFKTSGHPHRKIIYADGNNSTLKKFANTSNRNFTEDYELKRVRSAENIEKTVKLLDYITNLRETVENYQSNTDVLIPTRQELQKATKALSLLSTQESPYLDLMTNVSKIIHSGVFVGEAFFNHYLDLLRNAHHNGLKTMFIQNAVHKIPYCTLATLLMEELKAQKFAAEDSLQEKEKINKALIERNQTLEEKMQLLIKETHEKVIQNLKLQHKKELAAIQERNENLVELYEQSQKSLVQMTEDMAGQKAQSDRVLDENFKLNRVINDKNHEIHLHQQEFKKTREKLAGLHTKVAGFRDILDSILIQLNMIKIRSSELLHNRDEAEKEIDNLKLRAAVGFEELTPRPNYKQIMQEKNVDLNFRSEANFAVTSKDYNKPRLSTHQIFDGLLNRYLELLQKNKALEQEIQGNPLTSSPAVSRKNSKFILSVKKVGRLGGDHSAAPSPYLKPTSQGIVLNIPERKSSVNSGNSRVSRFATSENLMIPSNFAISRKNSDIDTLAEELGVVNKPISDAAEEKKEQKQESVASLIKGSEPSTPDDSRIAPEKQLAITVPEKPLMINISENLDLGKDGSAKGAETMRKADKLVNEITEVKKMVDSIISPL